MIEKKRSNQTYGAPRYASWMIAVSRKEEEDERICRSEVAGLIDLYHSLDSQIHTDHFQMLLVADSPSSNPNPPFEGREVGVMVPREVRVALEVSW
jgi:hypothetical protein